ncbi:helix-turn-helix domain-containing protein [Streptomyces sp. NPDC002680]|uniref:helix-turn-helix domain-containing protein n=1 Tax=Streptomyces sp. NPDC002680 TaxID=3364659 RepID=UPI00369A7E6C
MLAETVFSTEDVPAEDRFDWWRDRMELGDVAVWPTAFRPTVVRRTPGPIKRSDPETFRIGLVVRGTEDGTRGDRQAIIGSLEFLLDDSSQPCEARADATLITAIGVEVPQYLLPLSRADFGQLVGRRLSGREGIGALLAELLTRLTADADSFRPSDGPRLGTVVVGLVSALLTHELDVEGVLPPETRRRTLVLSIRAFVRQRLHDPGLTPAVIAAAHHISPSYLHRLFRDEDDTVASYLRRQRLERARRDLADPALRDVPVHRIASRWGFTHASAFTRVFRAAYGHPPSHHRRPAR